MIQTKTDHLSKRWPVLLSLHKYLWLVEWDTYMDAGIPSQLVQAAMTSLNIH
jgi:hypothetical protein